MKPTSRQGFTLLLLLSGWLMASAGFGQDVTTVLVAPSGAVAAGSRASLWMHYLNASAQEVTKKFPARLDCKLVSEQRTLSAVLERNNASGSPDAVVPPSGFARREYWLAVPESMAGSVVLEAASTGASKIVLEIQTPATLAKSGSLPPPSGSNPAKAPPPPCPDPSPVDFFKRHLFPHEPFYFIAGAKSPNAKFQISLKYRLIDSDCGLGRTVPPVSDLYVGYTQTSVWDWDKPSAPFVDTSYKPELFYYHRGLLTAGANAWFRLDLQGGVQHESNGKDGADSRSVNFVYLKPSLDFTYADKFQVTLAPRAWFYIWDLSDNPDIAEYRGYADLAATVGWIQGLQLATRFRIGDDGTHSALQFDLSYPLKRIPWLGLTAYVHAQYFTGYGETFLLYRQKSDAFRVGFSLYR